VIFPSWLAYLFWNKGIAAIGATRGEIYTHIIPLSGGVLSILFLHTQPHAWHLLSALLIMVGLGSARWRNARRRLFVCVTNVCDRAPGHARSQKLTAGGERLVMSRSCGLDHPAFATKKVRTVMTIATVPATRAIARP
jgi:hypothetical protein